MYLTNPTIDELVNLEHSALMDMLVYQTRLYKQLSVLDGMTSTTKACLDFINIIQAAIVKKQELKKNEDNMQASGTGQSIPD